MVGEPAVSDSQPPVIRETEHYKRLSIRVGESWGLSFV